MVKRLAAVIAAILWASPAASQDEATVTIELVLALDSSASVDRAEFQLQLDGLAAAFRDPDVLAAVDRLQPLGAAVAVIQWGGPGETRTVLPFTHLENARDAKAFGFRIGLIRRWMRASSTSIATAIEDAAALIAGNELDGQRLVIDVSGDGPDNGSADVDAVREGARAAGITVNGLAIEAEDKSLREDCRDRVITGADSFVEAARGFEDLARAIKEKLLRELRPLES
jgi:hypothetical protein